MFKRFLLPFFAVAMLASIALPSLAAYPEKPIRLIVPSAPGGAPDILMRALATQMSQQMGVPIVIDNKPGGSYVIGTMDLVRSPADGYTLAYANIVSLATNRSLLANVPYDVDRDLTLAGNAQLMMANTPVTGPHVQAGRVRALGISAGQRSPAYSDVPTIAEQGVAGFEVVAWGGLVGPANMPAEIVVRLNAEMRKALANPGVQERFRGLGIETSPSTPEEFRELARVETIKWAKVVKFSGAKVD